MLEKIAVTNWIVECIEDKGNIWGPFEDIDELMLAIECTDVASMAPMGAVPKKVDVHGSILSYRSITHLSAPRSGVSVNSCISEEDKKVQYIKFKEVAAWVANLGVGAWIWTADAKDAYMRVPTQPSQWKFMCFKWCCMFFVICSLPFGLASACKIYTAFADAIQWIMIEMSGGLFEENDEVNIFHYLDDFFGGSRNKEKATRQLQHVLNIFEYLGVPSRAEKCSAPSKTPIILGFEYDTVAQCVRIPEKKINRYVAELTHILSLKKIRKRDLLKIIGKLRWASAAIFPGAAFVRHLENEAYRCKKMHHFIYLNVELRRELNWWLEVLPSSRNGIPLDFILKKGDDFDVEILTDASTSYGVGGYQRNAGHKWFSYEWKVRTDPQPDIVFKELLGVCTAILLWAPSWKGKHVKLFCDNMGVVEMVKRKCCVFRRRDLMAMIRVIGRAAVKYEFYFKIFHIMGVDNKIADELSRRERIVDVRENGIVGSGFDCDSVVESLLACWDDNIPTRQAVATCKGGLDAEGVRYCVKGWDDYKKLRIQMRSGRQ